MYIKFLMSISCVFVTLFTWLDHSTEKTGFVIYKTHRNNDLFRHL